MHFEFIEGPIPPQKISSFIEKMESNGHTGAQNIFLGRVRADQLPEGQVVIAIDYLVYEEMAILEMKSIFDDIKDQYGLKDSIVLHSKGRVKVSEICIFVAVSAERRKDAFEACQSLVEKVKQRVPIWGKEIISDQHYKWKENT